MKIPVQNCHSFFNYHRQNSQLSSKHVKKKTNTTEIDKRKIYDLSLEEHDLCVRFQ